MCFSSCASQRTFDKTSKEELKVVISCRTKERSQACSVGIEESSVSIHSAWLTSAISFPTEGRGGWQCGRE